MSGVIRVVVADDHGVVREGIHHVLSGEAGFEIVGEAANSADAMVLVESLRPDVAVLDISMAGGSGLKLAARIRERLPEIRVLMLSMHDHPEYVLESVRAGAHGYLLKDTAAAELRHAIRAVEEGEAFYSPPVARRLSDAVRGELARERRTSELGISHRTVETHRESLMRKLRIRTVAGLTRFALELGLIDAAGN